MWVLSSSFLLVYEAFNLASPLQPSVNGIMNGPTPVLTALMGNRVFFNLRSEDLRLRDITRPTENPTSAAPDSLTTVRFASGTDPEVGETSS